MANSPNVLTATDTNFKSDVLSKGISLVDFWAEWCGPCRMIGPLVEQIADEYAGKAKVFKMNVDENPATPGQFSIRGIPTILVFKDGQLVDQLVGMQPKENIAQAIKNQMT